MQTHLCYTYPLGILWVSQIQDAQNQTHFTSCNFYLIIITQEANLGVISLAHHVLLCLPCQFYFLEFLRSFPLSPSLTFALVHALPSHV